MATEQSQLDGYDVAGIVVYLFIVVGVGLLSLFRSKRNTVSGYFLANKETVWYVVGASLFASNIGTEHFIGLAGSGATVAYIFQGLVALQLLGWVFLPVYIASKAYTLPEYIKKRFGGSRIRVYLASLSLILYIFTKISVALYSGILFINQSLHWNQWLAVLLLLAMTAVSSLTGGLKAAMYTEVLQAISILIGASAIFVAAFTKIGTYQNLVSRYSDSRADANHSLPGVNCSQPLPDAFVMLREPTDPNLPWVGFILGQTTVSIWYWAADQMMVQRALSAKSLSHAQGGCLVAGYFKFCFLFIMILPGMIARVLWPNEIACSNPEICYEICGNRRGCTDIAYPKMVMELLPSGLRGLMLAVMLSSLVSDLISIFNSASALFTIDIWSRMRKKASPREILLVGRFCSVFLLIFSVIWVPFIQQMQGGQLFFYIKALASYLSPPIGAVYILAVFWPRCNEQGAFFGLMAGFIVGVIRMILDFVYQSPECGAPDPRPAITKNVHFMYFAFLLFCITVIVAVVVSLLTRPSNKKRLIRTTYQSRFDETARPDDFKYDRRNSLLSSHGIIVATVGCIGLESVETMEMDTPKLSSSRSDSTNEVPVEKDGKCVQTPAEDTPLDRSVSPLSNGNTAVSEVKDEWCNTASRFLGCLRTVAYWFCGFSKLTILEKDEHDAHLNKVSSLEQSKKAKLTLNANLAFLLLLVVFVFIFFSTGLHDAVVFL